MSAPRPMSPAHTYRGRFAPSPTGPLHAGSLVAALGSWLDARAHGGIWLVRIEDLDPPREMPGAIDLILATLEDFGLVTDEPPLRQSDRGAVYDAALQTLLAAGWAYPCACSRRDADEAAARRGLRAGVYAGTCRAGIAPGARRERAYRLRVADETVAFTDRNSGRFEQLLARDVGDFVLKRADGLWAYQLAVVVDDAEQRVTDVVRGGDLLDNTPRQIWLQRCLGVGTPRYLHLPVVTSTAGEKLSKQTGAAPLDRGDVLGELERAWRHLGFPPLGARSRDAFLSQAIEHWRERWPVAEGLLESRL